MRFRVREKVTYEVVCVETGNIMGKWDEWSDAAGQHQRLVAHYRCRTCRGSGNDPAAAKDLPPGPPDPPRSFVPEKFRLPKCPDCNGEGHRADPSPLPTDAPSGRES